MRRRDFIAALGGVAAFPAAARAQQQTIPVIGFLSSLTQFESSHLVAAFAAKAQGIEIPANLHARSDEVIE